jgi:hypothetical protein
MNRTTPMPRESDARCARCGVLVTGWRVVRGDSVFCTWHCSHQAERGPESPSSPPEAGAAAGEPLTLREDFLRGLQALAQRLDERAGAESPSPAPEAAPEVDGGP